MIFKRILFVTSDEYPFDGASTNIIRTFFESASFLNNYEKFVLAKKPISYKKIDSNNIIYYCDPILSDGLLDLARYKSKILINFVKLLRIIKALFQRKKACDKRKTKTVYDALVKNRHLDFDLIVTVMGGKFYESQAVLKFSKHYGIPFLLYQLDPCMNNESEGFYNKKARRHLETSLYKNASQIITTPIIYHLHSNDSLKKYLFKVSKMEFPLVSDKTRRINKDNNEILCVFSGALYNPIRLPYYTVKLFEEVSKKINLKVVFVGRNCPSFNRFETSLNVVWKNSESREDVSQLLYESDFLINIGNTIRNQIPSKLFDYISRGKPIINVCKFNDCPSLIYLTKYPLVLNIIEDDSKFNSNVKKLESFLIAQRNATVPFSIINKEYLECTTQYCSDIFNRIVAKCFK